MLISLISQRVCNASDILIKYGFSEHKGHKEHKEHCQTIPSCVELYCSSLVFPYSMSFSLPASINHTQSSIANILLISLRCDVRQQGLCSVCNDNVPLWSWVSSAVVRNTDCCYLHQYHYSSSNCVSYTRSEACVATYLELKQQVMRDGIWYKTRTPVITPNHHQSVMHTFIRGSLHLD